MCDVRAGSLELQRETVLSSFVSITRLRIRSIRFLPCFAIDTFRSLRQVQRSAGFQGGSLLIDRRSTFWTMTVWDSKESMRAFMTTGSHRSAMPHLLDWCDEASVAHWEQAGPTLSSWVEAAQRMRREGRPSKVRFSSPGHATMEFAPPRSGKAAELRPRNPIDATSG